MPRQSNRAQILHDLDQAALALARATYEHVAQDHQPTDSLSNSSDSELDLNLAITPPSPYFSDFSDFDFDSSGDEADHITAHYDRL